MKSAVSKFSIFGLLSLSQFASVRAFSEECDAALAILNNRTAENCFNCVPSPLVSSTSILQSCSVVEEDDNNPNTTEFDFTCTDSCQANINSALEICEGEPDFNFFVEMGLIQDNLRSPGGCDLGYSFTSCDQAVRDLRSARNLDTSCRSDTATECGCQDPINSLVETCQGSSYLVQFNNGNSSVELGSVVQFDLNSSIARDTLWESNFGDTCISYVDSLIAEILAREESSSDDDDDDSLGLIIGGVVVVLVGGIAASVGFLIVRKRRGGA